MSMPQNQEATQFLSRIAILPKGNVSLDAQAVLQPSLDDEAELRNSASSSLQTRETRVLRISTSALLMFLPHRAISGLRGHVSSPAIPTVMLGTSWLCQTL